MARSASSRFERTRELGGRLARSSAERRAPRAGTRSRAAVCSRSSSAIRSSPLLESLEFLPQRIPSRDGIGQRRPVFPLEALEQRQPVLDLLQPRRRRFDAVGVPAKEDREVLELRLDGVARSRYG